MAELRNEVDETGPLTGASKEEIGGLLAGRFTKNTRLLEAVRMLVSSLPDRDQEITVTVDDQLADDGRTSHSVSVTVSSVAREIPKDSPDHDTTHDTARNDLGQRTDINARVVGETAEVREARLERARIEERARPARKPTV